MAASNETIELILGGVFFFGLLPVVERLFLTCRGYFPLIRLHALLYMRNLETMWTCLEIMDYSQKIQDLMVSVLFSMAEKPGFPEI